MLETFNHDDLVLFIEFFEQQGWLVQVIGGQ
jgi:hypothetical protein